MHYSPHKAIAQHGVVVCSKQFNHVCYIINQIGFIFLQAVNTTEPTLLWLLVAVSWWPLNFSDCGVMAASISNATVNQTGTLYEDTSEYACDLGYMIERGVTNLTLTCTSNGTWDGQAPTCNATGNSWLLAPSFP